MDTVRLIGRAHLNEVLIKLIDYSLTCPLLKIMISYLVRRPRLTADELASPKGFICHKSMNYWIAWWVITGHNVSEQRKKRDWIHEENKNFYPLIMTQWSFKEKTHSCIHTQSFSLGRWTTKLVTLATYLTGEIMQNRRCDIIKCHFSGTLCTVRLWLISRAENIDNVSQFFFCCKYTISNQ